MAEAHDPFTPTDWKKLLGALRTDNSPAAIILYVEAVTGLRVGDVLQISRKAFTKAHDEGFLVFERVSGRSRPEFVSVPFIAQAAAWLRLKKAWKTGDTIAEWLCPACAGDPTSAGFGAYRQLDRKLKAIGKTLKLKGRVHLHRIRRTVAMQELRAGKDLDVVQKKLGHRSPQATSRYEE